MVAMFEQLAQEMRREDSKRKPLPGSNAHQDAGCAAWIPQVLHRRHGLPAGILPHRLVRGAL